MGWLDFFRVKAKPEKEIKEMTLSEADIFIKKELSKENEKVEQIKIRMNEKISEFILNLETQIKILSLINLTEKRESEKLKALTMQGLDEYIDQLRKLINDLEKIDRKVKFYLYVKEVNLAFGIFIKHSHKKYQKATTLIGKELMQTKEMTKSFFKEIDLIVQEGKKNLSKLEKIENFQCLKKSLLKIKGIQGEMNNSISVLKREQKELMNRKSKEENELDLFKKSKEFESWLKEKVGIKNERQVLEKDIERLKEKINFKLLLNKFHSVPKSLELLKDYRENFLNTLMNDREFKLLKMIEGSEKKIIDKELENILEGNQALKIKEDAYKTNKKEEAFREDLRKITYQIEVIFWKIEGENKRLMKFIEKEKDLRKEKIKMAENILSNAKIIK